MNAEGELNDELMERSREAAGILITRRSRRKEALRLEEEGGEDRAGMGRREDAGIH